MPETEIDRLHKMKDGISKQPVGPIPAPQSGENPEVDNITQVDEAQKHRDQMQKQEKAEGDR